MSLIALVSLGFPMGALMTLKSKVDTGIIFAYRSIKGTPTSVLQARPEKLLLDGQQRMASLYQNSKRKQVVGTITAKKRFVKRWLYVDIQKARQADAGR